jgi:ABC-2 type transport system ATP-binding protein
MSRELPVGGVVVDRVWKRFIADRPQLSVMGQSRAMLRFLRHRTHRWALRDVSFRIEPGEAVGLIGANGSGKSTLLKIVNGVMEPYAGSVDVSGQVGALIELQSGLHPELTGRENVFLSGAFLGLARRTVAQRFDEIIEFAGLESALDRQVKRYSSGMRMRLGFAVAALLDPAVLLVDEVLAVGDAAFQQRCLEKLRESLEAGTTLVFVSHDLTAVEAVCRRGIWLDDGGVRADDSIAVVLTRYRQDVEERARALPSGEGPVRAGVVACTGDDGGVVSTGGRLMLTVDLCADRPRAIGLCLGITEGTAAPVVALRRDVDVDEEPRRVTVTIADLPLAGGRYAVWLGVLAPDGADLVHWHPTVDLVVSGPDLDPLPGGVARLAPVHVDAHWVVDRA